LALVALAVALLGLFAYGGWKRRQRQVAALADANLPKRVAPATAAAADIEKDVPSGNVPTARAQHGAPGSGQLQAPEDVQGHVPVSRVRNDTLVPAPTYARQNAPIQASVPPVQQVQQPTPEEQRIQAAYDSEQRAMAAPTSLRDGFGGASTGPASATDNPYQLASALQARSRNRAQVVTSPNHGDSLSTPQEAFLKAARTTQPDDYLKSTRTAPISEYEIKAGWKFRR
jgi:hypothetical protein